MIGFNSLGKMGRLGNQMFQYASLKGIATNRGYDYCVPSKENCLFDLFKMSEVKNICLVSEENTIREKHFHFDDKLFNQCPDNINIVGYLQSPKYFEHISENIKIDFNFKEEFKIKAKEYLKDIEKEDAICLYVRRGDYVRLQNRHPLCSLEYYEEALGFFDKLLSVLVCSDDTKWCAEQKIFQDNRFHILNTNNHFLDLCICTMIDNHIISNSTFAWWSAWLSNKKKVVAPKKWFGLAYNNYDTKDLIPTEWIRI